MTIHACLKQYPEFLTLNVLTIVIIIFIEFDDLTHLKKNMYDLSFMYKMGFPC